MKRMPRWLVNVIHASKTEKVTLPWTRATQAEKLKMAKSA
ncbi:hypothetical protein RB2150_15061 [Rhodobacteraceae bacterium HTCC2150]|nr:hypothetical protein RB2150_15061 [Rhodobacteraceae bacterium HTCC2150]